MSRVFYLFSGVERVVTIKLNSMTGICLLLYSFYVQVDLKISHAFILDVTIYFYVEITSSIAFRQCFSGNFSTVDRKIDYQANFLFFSSFSIHSNQITFLEAIFWGLWIGKCRRGAKSGGYGVPKEFEV